MILSCFKPLLSRRPNPIGHSLAQRAYPLDGRVPVRIEELLKRLDRRGPGGSGGTGRG